MVHLTNSCPPDFRTVARKRHFPELKQRGTRRQKRGEEGSILRASMQSNSPNSTTPHSIGTDQSSRRYTYVSKSRISFADESSIEALTRGHSTTARPIDAHIRERRRPRDVSDSRKAWGSSFSCERSSGICLIMQSLPSSHCRSERSSTRSPRSMRSRQTSRAAYSSWSRGPYWCVGSILSNPSFQPLSNAGALCFGVKVLL